MDYKEIIQKPEYDFIKTNEHLGKHVILLGLAGSYSYDTNIETSDIDIRGITLNQKADLIGLSHLSLIHIFAITELRKAKLLENSSVGNFHITDLGKKTVELLNNDNENLDFFEIIDLASQSNVENVNPVAPDSEDSSLEVDEATLTGVNNLEDIRVLLGKDKSCLLYTSRCV